MSYEQDLAEYVQRTEAVYRRAMEAKLSSLNNKQRMAVKQFQFDAKKAKETINRQAPDLIKQYKNLSALMLILVPGTSDYIKAEAALQSAESSLSALRSGLEHAAAELEKFFAN